MDISCSIIHLRRFEKLRNGKVKKLNSLVNFPIKQLNLKDFVVNHGIHDNVVYDLYGVTYHSGSCDGGHYFARCLNSIDNIWREFNDTSVSRAAQSDIVHQNAFLLFYKKR